MCAFTTTELASLVALTGLKITIQAEHHLSGYGQRRYSQICLLPLRYGLRSYGTPVVGRISDPESYSDGHAALGECVVVFQGFKHVSTHDIFNSDAAPPYRQNSDIPTGFHFLFRMILYSTYKEREGDLDRCRPSSIRSRSLARCSSEDYTLEQR